jgi:hypothetical protein
MRRETSARSSGATSFHDAIGANEGCGSNNVYWDPKSDTIYWSFFWSDTVVQLDRETG